MKTMPIWKWILDLVLGMAIFFIVYATAQMAIMIELQWLQSIIFIISGLVIIGLFLLWTKGFEKEWRMDTIFEPRKQGFCWVLHTNMLVPYGFQ